jgi:hypothetical protein
MTTEGIKLLEGCVAEPEAKKPRVETPGEGEGIEEEGKTTTT